VDDTRRHIAAGKQCTRLALTWEDRISFVLTESLAIKRIAPLDILKEGNDTSSKNDDERFDSDMVLMTAELNKLLTDLVFAFGGEPSTDTGSYSTKPGVECEIAPELAEGEIAGPL
jgi:recombination associated protein RdgC